MTRMRNDRVCPTCGVMRHRKCKSCGRGKLINIGGFLADHYTRQIHACDSSSYYREPEPEPQTQNIDTDSIIDSVLNDWRITEKVVSTTTNAIRDNVSSIVAEAVERATANITPQSISVTITQPNGIVYDAGTQHPSFERLCRLIGANINVLMVGDTGTGKTYSAEQAALALGLDYYPFSVGPTTQAYDLIGYRDANGNYVEGIAYKAYVYGGVLLLDEMDAASPESLVAINAMLANGVYSFPNGTFKRHDNFRVVAAANTFGTGADREYVGRQQLDASTLNRFSYIDWDYDASLETAILNGYCEAYPSLEYEFRQWLDYVHSVRTVIREHKIRQSASTRDAIEGFKHLVAGDTIEDIKYSRLFARMGNDATAIKDRLYNA